jgi:hypothetical protein
MKQRWVLLMSLSLAGCGPANPPPPGYVESCYGGDFRKHIEGSIPKRVITVKASESDWPRLARDISAAGRALGLDVFDTSATLNHVRTIEIHLCSKSGIWISADQRIWTGKNAEEANRFRNFGEVEITVNLYKRDFDWARVSDELARMLGKSWQVSVRETSQKAA